MKILFVCTGNVTRSLMADYLTRQILTSHDEVRSAGIRPNVPWGFTFDALETRGINAREHQATLLTQDLVNWADIIVGMEQEHIDAVAQLGKHAYLFNELATGEKTPLHDDNTTNDDLSTMHKLKAFLFTLSDEIEKKLPELIKRAREVRS